MAESRSAAALAVMTTARATATQVTWLRCKHARLIFTYTMSARMSDMTTARATATPVTWLRCKHGARACGYGCELNESGDVPSIAWWYFNLVHACHEPPTPHIDLAPANPSCYVFCSCWPVVRWPTLATNLCTMHHERRYVWGPVCLHVNRD